jgi:hypothetical protein
MGPKEQNWEKKLKFLLERSIAGDLRSSALALKRPRQGTSTPTLVRARRGLIAVRSSAHSLRSSAPVREAQVNRNPILESFILLGFC